MAGKRQAKASKLDVDAILEDTCKYLIEELRPKIGMLKWEGATGRLAKAFKYERDSKGRWRLTFDPYWHYARIHSKGTRDVRGKLMIVFKDPRLDPRIKADGRWESFTPTEYIQWMHIHEEWRKRTGDRNPEPSPIYIIDKSAGRVGYTGSKFFENKTIKDLAREYIKTKVKKSVYKKFAEAFDIRRARDPNVGED